MKQITLSEQDASRIDTYLELTSGRISEELKLWLPVLHVIHCFIEFLLRNIVTGIYVKVMF